MVWPGGPWNAICIVWRAYHGIWYGLAGIAWYMTWSGGNSMVYCMVWSGGHGIVYGMA